MKIKPNILNSVKLILQKKDTSPLTFIYFQQRPWVEEIMKVVECELNKTGIVIQDNIHISSHLLDKNFVNIKKQIKNKIKSNKKTYLLISLFDYFQDNQILQELVNLVKTATTNFQIFFYSYHPLNTNDLSFADPTNFLHIYPLTYEECNGSLALQDYFKFGSRVLLAPPHELYKQVSSELLENLGIVMLRSNNRKPSGYVYQFIVAILMVIFSKSNNWKNFKQLATSQAKKLNYKPSFDFWTKINDEIFSFHYFFEVSKLEEDKTINHSNKLLFSIDNPLLFYFYKSLENRMSEEHILATLIKNTLFLTLKATLSESIYWSECFDNIFLSYINPKTNIVHNWVVVLDNKNLTKIIKNFNNLLFSRPGNKYHVIVGNSIKLPKSNVASICFYAIEDFFSHSSKYLKNT